MDPTPLLGGHTAKSGTDLLKRFELCFRLAWNCAHVNFRSWWSVTTNPDYLTSWASRRNLQKWLLSLDIMQNLVLRYRGQKDLNLIPKLCYCFLVQILPKNKIWSDFVVVLAFVGTIIKDAFTDNVNPNNPDLFYDLWSPAAWGLLLLLLLGVHSTAGFVYMICLNLAMNYFDHSIAEKGLIQMIMNAPLIFVVEFRLASLFGDLQHKRKTLEVLLDKATDGFCSIEACTGIIQSASPQLEMTLGASTNLVGRRIYDFLQIGDHSSIEELLLGTSDAQDVSSKLVTCIQDPSESNSHGQVTFDAKMTPYAMSSYMVEICLQVQGEMRVHKGEPRESHDCRERSLSPLLGRETDEPSLQVCAEERASEISFRYTVTESLCSSIRKRSRRRLSPTPSSIKATMKDAEVQTDEPQLMPSGRHPKMEFFPKPFPILKQHSDQSCADANIHTLGSKPSIRPPTLPGNPMMPGTLLQAVSCVSRGRSPFKRERPSLKQMSGMNLAHARPALQSTKVQCLVGHADSTHQLTAPSPAPSVTAPSPAPSVGTESKPAPVRRKRRGQNLKMLDDTPITSV